jgi:hypothetical protein
LLPAFYSCLFISRLHRESARQCQNFSRTIILINPVFLYQKVVACFLLLSINLSPAHKIIITTSYIKFINPVSFDQKVFACTLPPIYIQLSLVHMKIIKAISLVNKIKPGPNCLLCEHSPTHTSGVL